jgi:4-hydroxy-2-oxoheptanedioate aldolase
MRRNPVKAALKAGQPQVGTWLSLGNVFAARLMARVGFNWLTVDLEHSPIGWDSAGQLFGAVADAGCTVLARVPRGDHDYIKRVLDAGAHGIVVPMVNTVEEAKIAIAAAKYPPTGNRSVGGGMHAMNFNATAGEYFKHANDEVLVAEAIYSLPCVDAIFVGPNDLNAQMRGPDGKDPTPAEHEAMCQRVLAAGKKCGTPVGIHVQTIEECQRRINEGWQFMALGSELRFMVTEAQKMVQGMNLKQSGDLARY